VIQEPIQPTESPTPSAATKTRSSNTLKVGLVVALCLALVVPVMIALAANSAPPSQDLLGLAAGASADPVAPSSAKPDNKDDHKGNGNGHRKGLEFGRGGGGPGRGPITIKSKNGSSLGLATENGWTRTIVVESTTTITKGGQPITLADLSVGDEIRFSEKKNDDGTYTITAIVVPTPRAGGKVTAVTDTTITVDGKGDTNTVMTVNGSTKYLIGKDAATKADVTVGDWIGAQGSISGTTFTATTVTIRPDMAGGVVTAKTADSITVKGRDDELTVIHVDSKTTFNVRGKDAATIADIAVGDWVGASGVSRADGSLDASVVGGMNPKKFKHQAPAASSPPS
jgi:hypothetical protein